ncbi:MAG: nucleotide exchange factor GrpE [Planctomycetes bacterium]|nr:nucleotide exchange factor GrpE [Planctomycetota bacterium]
MGVARQSDVDNRDTPDAEVRDDATVSEQLENTNQEAVEDPLEVLRRECEELREKNLRLLAEAQNLQKRAERDKREALRYAEADFARELLVVLDDLERTQESARTARKPKAVADGVRIVYEHFLKVLRERQVEPIEALGQPFDPSYHEAMMRQPSEECPAGTVIQELARGYRMHERVIRPSRVVVSSGPPEPPGTPA